MDDFPASMGGARHEPQPDAASIDSDQGVIYGDDDPNRIVTFAPKERFKLSLFDVTCLVLNRTIGTGIFNSPQRVMQGTHSTGASLLLWLLGCIYCISGTHVYIEYGLNVPRYSIDGGPDQSVARSGGDLNYLQFVYPYPRKDSVLFSACLFGIAFIALGNMAGNCISFSTRVMQAAGVDDPDGATVRGIAVATALLTCFIHTFSRRGGILLNNFLAIIKVMILLFIIIVAILVAANAIPDTDNVFNENTRADESFKNASSDANGFAQAFLAIIFGFSGFEQPNYVLGEVRTPRRYPIAMIIGVTSIVCLYMAVNLSYMVVVPKEDQINGDGVAQLFFEMSLGKIAENDTGTRIFNALLAVSSLGNIIVMTFTATRVKQEISKLGIIPFAKFFGQNTDLSLGRLLRWFQRKGYFSSLFRLRWLSPEQHSERTPFGALILHFCCCLILILATWSLEPDAAYNLLTSLSSYVINGFFGTFMGLGILILRFRGPPSMSSPSRDPHQPKARRSWAEMTGNKFNPIVSVVCASIYTVGNLWPVVTNWIQPSRELELSYSWWLAPTICWAIIGLGVTWFFGFVAVAWSKPHEQFVVEKQPEFDETEGGGLVLVHETVYLSWVAKESLRARRPEMAYGEQPADPATSTGVAWKGTDFDGFFQGQHQQQPGMYDPSAQGQPPQGMYETPFQNRQHQHGMHNGGYRV